MSPCVIVAVTCPPCPGGWAVMLGPEKVFIASRDHIPGAVLARQQPDTNMGQEDLEDTPANINVVLSSQHSSSNTTNRSHASALGTLLQTTSHHLRQKSSSVWAIKSCPYHVNMQTMSS